MSIHRNTGDEQVLVQNLVRRRVAAVGSLHRPKVLSAVRDLSRQERRVESLYQHVQEGSYQTGWTW